MLIVEPMPPVGNELSEDLNISIAAIPWADISPQLNDLPDSYNHGAVGICLPFSVTKLNSGPKPLTIICWPSTLLLIMLTPDTLPSASAKFSSGNLPISSALNASDIPTLLLLISIASNRLFLIPVTTISSTSSSELSASSSAEIKSYR
jgi:hypothetical protein